MAEKEDWPPPLRPGEHVLCLEELFILCVQFFALSKERNSIFAGFGKIVQELDRLDIPADLIIDGSFLTEEIDPDDIDFAVVVSQEYFDSCYGESLTYLQWIRDDRTIKSTHRCDCNLCVEFKAGSTTIRFSISFSISLERAIKVFASLFRVSADA